MKVFLGGTCSGWKWRNKFQKMLKCDYYNPMTHGWNEKDRQKEVYERKTADYVVYGITKGIKGVYSIAELIDDANNRQKQYYKQDAPSDIFFGKPDLLYRLWQPSVRIFYCSSHFFAPLSF